MPLVVEIKDNWGGAMRRDRMISEWISDCGRQAIGGKRNVVGIGDIAGTLIGPISPLSEGVAITYRIDHQV